jgi:hypothetical protein
MDNPQNPSVSGITFTTLIIVSPLLCRKSGFQSQQTNEENS